MKEKETVDENIKSEILKENEHMILEVTTCQTSSFKLIIEALKDALKDINIKFIKQNDTNEDSGGLSIVAYNPYTAVLIKVKIPARSFDKFYINPPNGASDIRIGVNMNSFNKLIKTSTNNDNLSLILEEDDKNYLGLKFENGDQGIITYYKLKLLELEDDGIHLPTTQFPFKIIIPSDRFHKIIRDASSIADKINIKFVDTKEFPNTLIFSCNGEFASQETILTDKTEGLSINKNVENDEDIIVKGTYDLKNLSLFSKCQNMCNNIELYLKNNFPLIIKYQVANLGHVLLVLSTVKNDDKILEDSDEEDNAI
jgi:proliferating cell nuclear antigen PCNA